MRHHCTTFFHARKPVMEEKSPLLRRFPLFKREKALYNISRTEKTRPGLRRAPLNKGIIAEEV